MTLYHEFAAALRLFAAAGLVPRISVLVPEPDADIHLSLDGACITLQGAARLRPHGGV